MNTGTWGLYYNYTWRGNAIQTAPSVIGKPDFFGSQFLMLTSQQPNQVVNGNFDTDSDWNIVNNTGTASEIINGYARIKTDGAYTQIDQPNVTIATKSYKLQYTILESDGGSLGFIITGNQTASIPTTVGTHIYYFAIIINLH